MMELLIDVVVEHREKNPFKPTSHVLLHNYIETGKRPNHHTFPVWDRVISCECSSLKHDRSSFFVIEGERPIRNISVLRHDMLHLRFVRNHSVPRSTSVFSGCGWRLRERCLFSRAGGTVVCQLFSVQSAIGWPEEEHEHNRDDRDKSSNNVCRDWNRKL